MTKLTGKVYLVGAGLGNVAYLTVKAYQLVKQAEVLVYDALVDQSIIPLISPHCLKVYVGKRGSQVSTPQSEINRLLVKYCQQGKLVVRLKGGDPFIFGRASAEIQALIAAKCEFEVVPGISSALAAPLLAGIPVTDTVMSRCFAVMTAHEPEALNWASLSELETLVILMAARNLPVIVHQLRQHGRSPETPIAIIKNGGRFNQKVIVGTLNDIVHKTSRESLSPSVIVVGNVVQLQTYLQPRHNHSRIMLSPLLNHTILVTRSSEQSNEFRSLLEQKGAEVLEMPTLMIRPPSTWEPLDQAIAFSDTSKPFDWLLLTSANAVSFFFERLLANGKDTRILASTKIAVVGKKTAMVLRQWGLNPDFIPPDFIADSLVENFPESVSGKRLLFPRVETGGREILVKELTQAGAEVVEVPAYESACPDTIDPNVQSALENGIISIATFTSSKTVKNFCKLLEGFAGDSWRDLVTGVAIASIGPQTSQTCQTLLGRVDIEAQEYTLEGLTQAIIDKM
ncbi:uroporphyrinogen-III C-methyltransferase [Limnospira fusiformis CCALA 023]